MNGLLIKGLAVAFGITIGGQAPTHRPTPSARPKQPVASIQAKEPTALARLAGMTRMAATIPAMPEGKVKSMTVCSKNTHVIEVRTGKGTVIVLNGSEASFKKLEELEALKKLAKLEALSETRIASTATYVAVTVPPTPPL